MEKEKERTRKCKESVPKTQEAAMTHWRKTRNKLVSCEKVVKQRLTYKTQMKENGHDDVKRFCGRGFLFPWDLGPKHGGPVDGK